MNIEIDNSSGVKSLVIKDAIHDKGDREYEIKMIDRNSISVFLSLRENYINDEIRYEYDITSMTSLYELSKRTPLRLEELKMLIGELKKCREVIAEYLLSSEGLILDPDYVFYDRNAKKLKFCFYPWNERDEFGNYTQLAEFLLSAIDYGDELCVKLAYDVYASVLNKDYELWKLINEDMKKDEGTESLEMNVETPKREEPEPEEVIVSHRTNGKPVKKTLSTLSVICLTLISVSVLMILSMYFTSRRLLILIMRNTFSDMKNISVIVLVLSVTMFIPIMNILDIIRAGRKKQQIQRTC